MVKRESLCLSTKPLQMLQSILLHVLCGCFISFCIFQKCIGKHEVEAFEPVAAVLPSKVPVPCWAEPRLMAHVAAWVQTFPTSFLINLLSSVCLKIYLTEPCPLSPLNIVVGHFPICSDLKKRRRILEVKDRVRES